MKRALPDAGEQRGEPRAAPATGPELLVAVLDARLAAESSAEVPALFCLWDSLLVLLRAHGAVGADNRACLFGASSRAVRLLAEGRAAEADWAPARPACAQLCLEEHACDGAPQFALGLSLALCYANRLQREDPALRPRVLAIDCSRGEADLAAQSAAIISCAYAARAAGVPVDCLSLGPAPSAALRQAAALSGGRHLALPAASSGEPLAEVLAPALLFHFLPGVAVRGALNATEDAPSLAAVCACHGEPQEVAFVCSCCLAPYCSDAPAICQACRTRFRPERESDRRLRELAPEEVCA
ncbi:unnamed protein product [Prorocentrum cordatum]|uniref:General transcription factor IIH subunit 3 n=1 Tax=Prorocentrum cordatum TaxID=2364126 RepID=A0ABN9UMZ5_9DINO|nr:unnamed protein product [Polarella glacialis]